MSRCKPTSRPTARSRSATSERTLSIDGYQTFFGYRDYDFMPDGERLVMVFPAGLEETSREEFVPRANVVVNWAEELKERLSIP